MRIVGGAWRGRPLAGPKTHDIRPTSDRLREAVFNVLAHAHLVDACFVRAPADPAIAAVRAPFEDLRVLDLFAGTGALGLEALSRGAVFALFVDDGAQARGLIRANVETLGAGGVSRIFRRDATRLGAIGPMVPFDLVFCDPPYGRALASPALVAAADGGWLRPGAVVVVEEARAAAFAPPAGFTLLETRDYGETAVTFLRWKPDA